MVDMWSVGIIIYVLLVGEPMNFLFQFLLSSHNSPLYVFFNRLFASLLYFAHMNFRLSAIHGKCKRMPV